MTRGVGVLAAAVMVLLAAGIVVLASHQPVRTLHVDPAHPATDDGNPGTADQPLSTLSEAALRVAANDAAGAGTHVLVHPGVYREAVILPPGGRGPVTWEGTGDGEAVISGADAWTDWQRVGDGTYEHDWPHRWGVVPLPDGWEEWWVEHDISEVVQRRELVFIDGEPLRQVLEADELVEGTFHVDETRGRLTIHLPGGRLDVPVEVAVRPRAFEAEDWQRVTLRGLTFRHAASPIQDGAVELTDVAGARVEDSRFEWNNWAGLRVRTSRDVTITGSAASHNGVMGLALWRVQDLVVEDTQNSANNWRGDWGGYHDWEAGSKFMGLRRAAFRGFVAEDNRSHGLWLDYDNADVTVTESFLARNLRHGVFLEASQGPIRLESTTICDNRGAGVLDGKADRVLLAGNRVFGNADAQLLFAGQPGGRVVLPWDTDDELVARSEGWRLRGNTIADGGGPLVAVWSSFADWDFVRASLDSDANRWGGDEEEAFALPHGETIDLDGWRRHTGGDAASTFAETAPLRCAR